MLHQKSQEVRWTVDATAAMSGARHRKIGPPLNWRHALENWACTPECHTRLAQKATLCNKSYSLRINTRHQLDPTSPSCHLGRRTDKRNDRLDFQKIEKSQTARLPIPLCSYLERFGVAI